jgi:hypothetical protein
VSRYAGGITLVLTREEAASLSLVLEQPLGFHPRTTLLCTRVAERIKVSLGDFEQIRTAYLRSYEPRAAKNGFDCPVHGRALRRDRTTLGALVERFYCPVPGCEHIREVSA